MRGPASLHLVLSLVFILAILCCFSVGLICVSIMARGSEGGGSVGEEGSEAGKEMKMLGKEVTWRREALGKPGK